MKHKIPITIIGCAIIGLLWLSISTAQEPALPLDSRSRTPIQGIMRPDRMIRIIVTDSTSVRSDSLTASIVRLYCPNDVYFDIGNYQNSADQNDILLPGGIIEYFNAENYEYISARLKTGATGDTVYVVEMK